MHHRQRGIAKTPPHCAPALVDLVLGSLPTFFFLESLPTFFFLESLPTFFVLAHLVPEKYGVEYHAKSLSIFVTSFLSTDMMTESEQNPQVHWTWLQCLAAKHLGVHGIHGQEKQRATVAAIAIHNFHSFTAFSTHQLCLFKTSTPASRRKLIPCTVNLGRKAEIAWFGCHPLQLWNRSFLWSSKLYGIYIRHITYELLCTAWYWDRRTSLIVKYVVKIPLNIPMNRSVVVP